jgi:NitT/TauT family transport system substrate-binding protein
MAMGGRAGPEFALCCHANLESIMGNFAGSFAAALVASCTLMPPVAAAADDLLKVAVTQRGQWDTAVVELGQRSGILRKRGLDVEILYTQGGPEAHQAVIAGSMELACGGGIESAISAIGKGAPLRIIGSEMIGSPDLYWYVPANSPIKSLRDAAGKTISFSQAGSSSYTALMALLDQHKVAARPVATGGMPATLTVTMTGQIDIGHAAAPFGLDLVEDGRIRVIAQGSEIAARAQETVRVCVANADVLAKRRPVVVRFMQAYRDTLDWMYSDPAAIKAYEEFSRVKAGLMTKIRDQYFPKASLWPDEIDGLNLVMADALKNKFLARPLTDAEVADLIQVPPPVK